MPAQGCVSLEGADGPYSCAVHTPRTPPDTHAHTRPGGCPRRLPRDRHSRAAQAGKTSNCLPGCRSRAHRFLPICLLSCPPTDLTIILMPICLIVGFAIPPLPSEILQEFQFGVRFPSRGFRRAALPFSPPRNASEASDSGSCSPRIPLARRHDVSPAFPKGEAVFHEAPSPAPRGKASPPAPRLRVIRRSRLY